jgi:hypothetical protein
VEAQEEAGTSVLGWGVLLEWVKMVMGEKMIFG